MRCATRAELAAFTTPSHSLCFSQLVSQPLQGLLMSVSRSAFEYQSHPPKKKKNIFAYFLEIIKRRLQRTADNQSANQQTRLNPTSESVSQMANKTDRDAFGWHVKPRRAEEPVSAPEHNLELMGR